ncbi:MAG: tetratricopeptide repeat protein [Bacteroidales bacterium]|nr:tetratricopeptide repeat protein [Bacteroidales bacterium]
MNAQIFLARFLAIVILSFSTQIIKAQGVQSGNNLQLAQKYEQNGETEKALSLYAEAFEEDQSPYIYEQYLNALLKAERFSEAEKTIKIFQKKSNNPALQQIDLGYVELLREKATTKATTAKVTTSGKRKNQSRLKSEEIFQDIIDNLQSPTATYILQELSQAFSKRIQTSEYSIKLYQKARANSKNEDMYAEELGMLYRQNGEVEKMLDEFIKVLKKAPQKQAQIEENIQVFIGTNPEKQQEIRKILQLKMQKEPQGKTVQTLYIWALWQEKMFEEALKQSIDFSVKFNDGGEKIFETAFLSTKSEDFITGEKGFKYLIEHNGGVMAQRSKMELLNLYFTQIEKEQTRDKERIEKIKNEYKILFSEMEKNSRVLPVARNLARIYGYYLHDLDSAEALLNNVLQWAGINEEEKAQVKLDLADILLFSGKVWDATLLYGQVEKDFKQNNIGFYAKLQNARLFYYIGEFAWAKSQLDVLKAATSKVIANDAMELSLFIKEHPSYDSSYYGLEIFAEADFLAHRKLYVEALQVLDTLLTSPFEYDLFDDALYKKAEIYVALDSTQKAIRVLEQVSNNYPESIIVDDALFLMAELYERTPETTINGKTYKELAMEAYEKLFMDYSGSSLAVIARERYRLLRGDSHAKEEQPSQGVETMPRM